MEKNTKQTAFRLPEGLVERIDAYAETLMAATPGLNVSRADAVRMLLLRALDEVAPVKQTRRIPK